MARENLSQSEIQLLFNEGLVRQRDRCLFAVALFTARINEVCTLRLDVYDTRAGFALDDQENEHQAIGNRTSHHCGSCVIPARLLSRAETRILPGRFNRAISTPTQLPGY